MDWSTLILNPKTANSCFKRNVLLLLRGWKESVAAFQKYSTYSFFFNEQHFRPEELNQSSSSYDHIQYLVVRKGPSRLAMVDTKTKMTANKASTTLINFVINALKLEFSMPSMEISCCCCCWSSIFVICGEKMKQ